LKVFDGVAVSANTLVVNLIRMLLVKNALTAEDVKTLFDTSLAQLETISRPDVVAFEHARKLLDVGGTEALGVKSPPRRPAGPRKRRKR
jgi:hypothetical protein